MDRWRVEELAEQADVSVDTIRFYQKRRLLPPPRREGRLGFYGPEHLERLARIRDLRRRGLTLALIGRLVREAVDLTEEQGWERNTERSMEVFRGGDMIEGATAFAEKRKPVWKSS